jgi:cytochrome c-type biogenesis protein CcmH/NrfG
MSYLKGLMIAAAIDLVWIMACPITTTGPEPLPPVEIVAAWPAEARVESEDVDFTALGELEDSLMLRLREHPNDVDALQQVAEFYAEHGWYESAIGPLARALQLDPSRRSLWVALDSAVEGSGRAKITDEELTRRAAQFKEAVSMWGHGC